MHIKQLWKNHPLYKQGKVELVSTDWVWRYFGPDVSQEANLMDGSIVGMDKLWENLVHEGMYDPLIMRVGLKNKKFRLESGNHRIQLFHKHNIKMIPVTVQVVEECGPYLDDVMTNASHNFDIRDDLYISEITQEYMKPSEVFKNLSEAWV